MNKKVLKIIKNFINSNEKIKELSQNDLNMKIRSAAFTAVEKLNLN